MITLFVANSCADAKEYPETVDSFGRMATEVHRVASLDEINRYDRVSDWYGVIYDDEAIDDPLKEGLKVFLKETKADVLVLFKKKADEEKAFMSPRIFRRHITLQPGSLSPEQKVIYERVLNGWIHDIG